MRPLARDGGASPSRLGDALSDAAGYGWCASHGRWSWGFRLHTLMASDGTPKALPAAPEEGESPPGC